MTEAAFTEQIASLRGIGKRHRKGSTVRSQAPTLSERKSFLKSHPVGAYFTLTYAVSWLSAFAVAAPHLLRHEPVPKLDGLMMFPAMLLGPSLVGILLTRFTDGKTGLRHLFSEMRQLRVPAVWYAALLIAPALILAVLCSLKLFASPVFTPSYFPEGIAFGLIAGFFEEIGWTGYAFPKMRARHNGFMASILLGLLWGLWHVPVVDYLGTAAPHGAYWLRFLLAFVAAMTAMRVIICWVYVRTGSVLLAQWMHASSTGCLVIFSPVGVKAGQEVFWYAIYAVALWIAVALIVVMNGSRALDAGQSR